jgi:hypothetical protein
VISNNRFGVANYYESSNMNVKWIKYGSSLLSLRKLGEQVNGGRSCVDCVGHMIRKSQNLTTRESRLSQARRKSESALEHAKCLIFSQCKIVMPAEGSEQQPASLFCERLRRAKFVVRQNSVRVARTHNTIVSSKQHIDAHYNN